MRYTGITALLALAGCDQIEWAKQEPWPRPWGYTPPQAYLDQKSARKYFDPCFVREVRSRGVIMRESKPDHECYRFLAPQRWSGVFYTDDAEPSFCLDADVICSEGIYHLSWRGDEPEAFGPHWGKHPIRLEMIGRRTAVAGGYGHMDASKHIILIDRILSVRPLPESVAQ